MNLDKIMYLAEENIIDDDMYDDIVDDIINDEYDDIIDDINGSGDDLNGSGDDLDDIDGVNGLDDLNGSGDDINGSGGDIILLSGENDEEIIDLLSSIDDKLGLVSSTEFQDAILYSNNKLNNIENMLIFYNVFIGLFISCMAVFIFVKGFIKNV